MSQNPLQKRAATLRQKAIEKFMDSFESEFEIPPTRLVEAMAQLPAEELTKNPEETADSVVAQLDLTEEQKDHAKAMYLTLVSDLNRIDKSSQPPMVVVADPHAMAGNQLQERFVVAQEKKSLLNDSLQRMNNNFWMKSVAQNTPVDPGAHQSMEKAGGMDPWAKQDLVNGYDRIDEQDILTDPTTVDETPFKENPLPGPIGPKSQELDEQGALKPGHEMRKESSTEPAKAASGPDLMAQLKKLSEEQGQKSMSENGQAPADMNKAAAPAVTSVKEGIKGQAMKSDVTLQAVAQGQVQAAGKNPQQGEGFGGKNSGKGDSSKDSSKDGGKEASGKSAGKSMGFESVKATDVSGQATPVKSETHSLSHASPVVAPATPGQKEVNHDANLRQIMNQAQYLIKKGGGEVKVEMSPEGLGQVHMKMQIHDGKVNLQMATDTKEAKQAIEGGLSDLKSSLAAHKLSVDHVKVDVVSSGSAGSSAQNSSQDPSRSFDQQVQRESTRQFWNQFQENFGNRSQKEGYADAPDLKGYGARRRDPLAPVEGSSAAQGRNVEGKGGGINLVA
jgi:flagellar hook-length control protein FliK